MRTAASSVDQITTELHERGWSCGYTRVWTPRGLVGVADTRKDGQTCIAKASTETEALAELLKLLPTEDEG